MARIVRFKIVALNRPSDRETSRTWLRELGEGGIEIAGQLVRYCLETRPDVRMDVFRHLIVEMTVATVLAEAGFSHDASHISATVITHTMEELAQEVPASMKAFRRMVSKVFNDSVTHLVLDEAYEPLVPAPRPSREISPETIELVREYLLHSMIRASEPVLGWFGRRFL